MRRGRRSPVVTVASDGLGAGPCAGGISLVGGDAGAGLHVLVAVVRGRIKAWRRPLPDGAAPYLWPSAHGRWGKSFRSVSEAPAWAVTGFLILGRGAVGFRPGLAPRRQAPSAMFPRST
jgi:hypothetical protein